MSAFHFASLTAYQGARVHTEPTTVVTTTTTTESTTTTPPPTTTTTTTPEPGPVAEHELPVEGSTRWMEYPSDESQAGSYGNTDAQFLGPNLSTLDVVTFFSSSPCLRLPVFFSLSSSPCLLLPVFISSSSFCVFVSLFFLSSFCLSSFFKEPPISIQWSLLHSTGGMTPTVLPSEW